MKRIFVSLLLFPCFVLIPEQNKSDFDSLKKKYEEVRKHLDNKNGDHWFLMRDENKDYSFLMRAAARDISKDPKYAIAVVKGLNTNPNTYIDCTGTIIGFNDYGQVYGSILMHAIVSTMQSAQKTGECHLEVIKRLLEKGGDPEKNVLSVFSKNRLKQLEEDGSRMFKNARELAEYYAAYDEKNTEPIVSGYYDELTRDYSDQDGCRCCGDILKLFDEVKRKNSTK